MGQYQPQSEINWPAVPDRALGDPERCAGWPIMDSVNPSKKYVMDIARDLVAHGLADWADLGGGEIELRLASGEVFILGVVDLTRIR